MAEANPGHYRDRFRSPSASAGNAVAPDSDDVSPRAIVTTSYPTPSTNWVADLAWLKNTGTRC